MRKPQRDKRVDKSDAEKAAQREAEKARRARRRESEKRRKDAR